MLQKAGVEDNVSFYGEARGQYGNDKGKSDLILNLVWHKDFSKAINNHLTSSVDRDRKDQGMSGN